MRPSRPLPTLPSKLSSKTKSKKSQRKTSHTLSRAKVQKIDPKLWDSVHVTEKMLQSIIIAPSVSNILSAAPIPTTNDTPSLDGDDDDESSTMSIDEPIIPATKVKAPSPPKPLDTQTSPRTATEYAMDPDIQQENSIHLKLLSNMFASDWNGRETIQEDSSESEDTDGNKAVKYHEEISLSRDVTNAGEGETQRSVEDIVMKDAQEPESSKGTDENKQGAPSPASDHPTKTQKSKEKLLKDLFKPQEDSTSALDYRLLTLFFSCCFKLISR